MDKYEYRTKYDEMKALMKEGRIDEALDLIDSMNWNKVHNVNALVKAGEICREAGRLEEAKELLYLAHERSPIGRMIIYHLAMVCVDLGELEEAQELYAKFVEIAPHDSLKYVMKYQIGKARGADDTTLISVLEELKEHDFLEEWSYELAYLYHKTMQIEKCINLCDEIILWFGDGPYVERALEMKMLYQPLDKAQEDKYRSFQQKRDGITEIRANEQLSSGEIVSQTLSIPSVELPPERFNTFNLQAEIKKNIDEIMRATEAEAVSENMENIKTLVEEIPYLQVTKEQNPEVMQQTNAQIDAALKDHFQEYLAEEYDGQISLLVPERKEAEEQVKGQMTIEDVMEEWEKTKRAAKAALQEAEQKKLETARNKALKEASEIMDRLEEVIPKLDAGTAPADLLKEEYLTKEHAAATFTIPRIPHPGAPEEAGLEIPILDPAEVQVIKGEEALSPSIITREQDNKDTKEWQPPILNDGNTDAPGQMEESLEEQPPEVEPVMEGRAVDYKEASRIVEDVNQMLQKEIDRILEENKQEERIATAEEIESLEELPESNEYAEEAAIDLEKVFGQPMEALADVYEEMDAAEEPSEGLPEEDEVLPEIEAVSLEPDEVVELIDEKVLEQAIREEIPSLQLSEEEKEIFSYFMPISGMESSICQALTGAKYHLEKKRDSAHGNMIIQGGVGSGKTMLASNLIKVLQMETGRLQGNTGKIDARQLNIKDIAAVFTKVNDGCLIIEGAGDLSEKATETLRQQMVREDCSVMVILEDDRDGIEKVLSRNTSFSAMFTEKITIPVFTIDELVNFGKVYALEEGYVVDEMAILAMYNRINLIQRLDHPTSLIEVRDIVESAIEHAEKGGLKATLSRIGTKRYDEEGNLILREQDFEG